MTPEIRQRNIEAIRPGLVHGLGEPEPGKKCLEAAL
jgi:hypothetical protein